MILLSDDMSAHWTTELMEYAARQRVHLIRVPPQFPFCCQTADVAWKQAVEGPASSEVDLRAPRSDQEQRQSRRSTTISCDGLVGGGVQRVVFAEYSERLQKVWVAAKLDEKQ